MHTCIAKKVFIFIITSTWGFIYKNASGVNSTLTKSSSSMTRLSARYSCHIQLHTRIAYCVKEGVNYKRHVNTWVAPIAYQSTVHDKHSFGLVFITGTTCYVFVETTSSNHTRIDASLKVAFDAVISLLLICREMSD